MAQVVHTPSRRLFSDFAPYPRWVLRSGKLTDKETSWYLWFLSHDEGYEITKDRIMAAFPGTKEHTYRVVMRGLDLKGLVTRSQKSRGRNSFERVDYVVHIPSPEEVDAW